MQASKPCLWYERNSFSQNANAILQDYSSHSGLQGREGGRSRGDYGSRSDGGGRGRSYGDAASHGGPTNILTHRNSSTDSSGFQEAGPAKIKGRNRGWETQTPATASKAQEPASQVHWPQKSRFCKDNAASSTPNE